MAQRTTRREFNNEPVAEAAQGLAFWSHGTETRGLGERQRQEQGSARWFKSTRVRSTTQLDQALLHARHVTSRTRRIHLQPTPANPTFQERARTRFWSVDFVLNDLRGRGRPCEGEKRPRGALRLPLEFINRSKWSEGKLYYDRVV